MAAKTAAMEAGVSREALVDEEEGHVADALWRKGGLGDVAKEDTDTVGYVKDVLSCSYNKVVAVLATRWSDVHV